MEALRKAGAVFDEGDAEEKTGREEVITKADLYTVGLSGKAGSAEKRKELLRSLNLPERMSADAMLDILNAMMERDEFFQLFP